MAHQKQIHNVVETISMLLASHHSTSSFLAYLRLETLPFRFTLVVELLFLVFLWVFLSDGYLFKLYLVDRSPDTMLCFMGHTPCYVIKTIYIYSQDALQHLQHYTRLQADCDMCMGMGKDIAWGCYYKSERLQNTRPLLKTR